MAKCKLCHERPATVPDRNKPGAWRAEVCGQCHAGRLAGDFVRVAKAAVPKFISPEDETCPNCGACLMDGCECEMLFTGHGPGSSED